MPKNYILKINDYKLPGHNYLLKIAPPSKIKHLKTNLIPENSKTASVLMLFYPDINNETRLDAFSAYLSISSKATNYYRID